MFINIGAPTRRGFLNTTFDGVNEVFAFTAQIPVDSPQSTRSGNAKNPRIVAVRLNLHVTGQTESNSM